MATDTLSPQPSSPSGASNMAHDKMENDKIEHDKKAHVIASNPMPQEQSQVSPPAAPSPTTNNTPPSIAVPGDCPPKCPQEDHVKVEDEAQEDVQDAKSDSSELEYFDTHDDDITSPIEALNDYGPGGFHPVHLGDTLGPISDPSRFRVLHKLGHGGFGTVWLCRDTKDGKPKALKILSAYASEKAATQCPDFRALQLLTDSVSHEEGLSQSFPQAPQAHETAQDLLQKHHIALPYEHFWLPYQPNGSHLCLITPFLGPNLESFCATYGHVTDLVKHVCFQLVEAMHFLHKKGLCHGDFRPANILFCLKEEVERMGDEELVDALGGVQMAKLTRTPRNNMKGAKEKEKEWPKELPRYFVGQADMIKLIRGGWCSSSVAVIDFGVSYPVNEPPGKGSGIPLGYAPAEEAITGKNKEDKEETLIKLGPKSDIWSLGVTLSELALDHLPFADSNDKMYGVKNMEMIMGPIPEPFRSEFRAWYKGIWGESGTALQNADMVTDPETGETVLSPLSFSIKRWREEKKYTKEESGYEDPIRSKMSMGLETLHTKKSGADIETQWAKDKTKLPAYTWGQTEEEEEVDDDQFLTKKFDDIEVVSDLLMSIFKWMPEDRVSTAEILAHPWFADRCASKQIVKPEGLVSRLSQGTFGIINFMAGFPFKAGKFFFSAFSRLFGIFANPIWFLRGGRSRIGRRRDLESQ